MKTALLKAIEERGLVSLMNDTRWTAFSGAIKAELPFTPAFQRKNVLSPTPHPEQFDDAPWYTADWDAGLVHAVEIEWIRVRPRRVISRGRLLSPQIDDITEQFAGIVERLRIPHERQADVFTVIGYTVDTSKIRK